MGVRQVRCPWLTDVIALTDATPTVSAAASYAVPTGASGYAEIHYTVKGTNLVASGSKRIPFRNAAGTTTALAALIPLAIGGDAGLATVLVDATTSGATLQPRVTGIALTNLSITLDVRYTVD